MLPVIIFARESGVRSKMLQFLNEYAKASGNRFSVLDNTGSAEEAAHSIDTSEGILLMIAGVGSGKETDRAAVGLERLALRKNRDSYTVYWLSDVERLPALASSCLRPVGFLLPPPDQGRFELILKRVFEDYASLSGGSEEDFLPLQSGGTVHRLPVSSIDYIEALDKKLNIWTKRQCLTVYEKLAHIEELLGKRFFRCHRSYLVRFAAIESVDYAAMELRLAGDIRVPLSRSSKSLLKERIREEGLPDEG